MELKFPLEHWDNMELLNRDGVETGWNRSVIRQSDVDYEDFHR